MRLKKHHISSLIERFYNTVPIHLFFLACFFFVTGITTTAVANTHTSYVFNASTCDTIAVDDFETNATSGGSGWANNWTLSSASFVSGEVFMNGSSFGTASRTVDLSSYTDASLSFTFRCSDSSSGFESDDYVRVQVSIDGGITFTDYWYKNGNEICAEGGDNETYTETVLIPTGNANTVIRLEAGTNSGSEDVFWDNVVIGKSAPSYTAFAIQPSCTDGVPNSDGYLQLTSLLVGDRYHYSTGTTFNDSGGTDTYATATTITGTTYPLPIVTNLSNPTGTQDYTIRVYNGSNTCFTDVVVTMEEQSCATGCNCKEYLYVNEPDQDAVHKFLINADGSLNEIGDSWYPGTAKNIKQFRFHRYHINFN